MNFRNDIQGLRALAVLFVFIFHLSNKFLPGGFIGVDVFFVISGYLVSKIILSKIEKDNFKIKEFYQSRLKRIVPAYFFLLIFSWIGFYFIYIIADIGNYKMSHFWAVLFNSNYFFSTIDNYFGASSNEMPLLHTWTLGIEMQFYLILPLLLWFYKKRYFKFLLISLTFILIAYSSYQIIVLDNKGEMYFSLLARIPEFLIGILLSVYKIESFKMVSENANKLSLLGLLGLLITLVFYNENSIFPGFSSLLPCISTALLLVAPSSRVNAFLSNKIFVFIGEISYSIYLWHWPIIAFMRYYYSRYDLTIIEVLLVIIFTLLTSIVSYYIIEKPIRLMNIRKVYFYIGAMFFINVLLIVFTTPLKFSNSDIPIQYIYPSKENYFHSKTFKNVGTFGNVINKQDSILVLGDSHAFSLVPYFEQFGKKHNFSFRVLTNDSYPTIPGLTKNEIKEKRKLEIYNNLESYIFEEIKNSNVIIILFKGTGNKWVKALKEMIDNLSPNQKILFMPDYPSLDVNPVRINRSHLKDKKTTYQYQKTKVKLDKEILEIINSNPKVELIDFSEFDFYFSDSPFLNDTLMYYDSNHLNFYGATNYEELTGEKFKEYLKKE